MATNNETSFFRDPTIFSMLTQTLVPALKTQNPGLNRIQFWSAAGSTGQEAYSIAMAMDQARNKDAGLPDFDILVSDVSERVLNRSKDGVYTQLEVQRGLSARTLIDYFDKEGEASWKAKDKLRNKLRFKKINLLEPFPSNLGTFDIIFCRNVLIYQSLENKVAVVAQLLKFLKEGGFLVLGAAESMLGVSSEVEQVRFENAVAYQKKTEAMALKKAL
jgi:chemotaxis protein methyltransferase CheR